MRTTGLIAFLFAFTLPLFAQRIPLDEHQLGAYKGSDDAVRSVMDYCNAIDDAAEAQQPRIFAEMATDSGGAQKTYRWVEFADRDEWIAASKPAPLAFVWHRDGAIVRVTIVSGIPRVHTATLHRIDYCYGADVHLARIRAVPTFPQQCEYLFPCRLISDREFLLGGQRPAVTDWIFTEDGTTTKLRNGKPMEDYFDPANSLTVEDLHLKTSADLPFDRSAIPFRSRMQTAP